jgi:hypothetical protein
LKVFRPMAARTGRLGRMSSLHAGDHPIAEAEVGERRREPIENQQLLLAEDRHNRTAPTGRASLATDRPGGGDGQVTHGPMLTSWRFRKKS